MASGAMDWISSLRPESSPPCAASKRTRNMCRGAGARRRSIGAKTPKDACHAAEYFESSGARPNSNGAPHHDHWSSAPHNAFNWSCRKPDERNRRLGTEEEPPFGRFTADTGGEHVDCRDCRMRPRADKSVCKMTTVWDDLSGSPRGSLSEKDAHGRLAAFEGG